VTALLAAIAALPELLNHLSSAAGSNRLAVPASCHSLPDWISNLKVLGVSISISHILDTYGYIMVAVFIAIESTGIPFPGETMLLSASVYAALGCGTGMQEQWVIVACIIGATTGDNIGFWVGRTGGRALLKKIPFVKESHLAPAERYFQKYGGATVFFGRFLAVLRAWAAFLAGVNQMRPLKFFLYNLSGAVIWSTTFGLLGYELGSNLDKLKSIVSALGVFGLIVFFVLVGIGVGLFVRRRRSSHHDQAVVSTSDTETPPANLPLPTPQERHSSVTGVEVQPGE
jgi:membrane protein DedA with SNARE-associated domain